MLKTSRETLQQKKTFSQHSQFQICTNLFNLADVFIIKKIFFLSHHSSCDLFSSEMTQHHTWLVETTFLLVLSRMKEKEFRLNVIKLVRLSVNVIIFLFFYFGQDPRGKVGNFWLVIDLSGCFFFFIKCLFQSKFKACKEKLMSKQFFNDVVDDRHFYISHQSSPVDLPLISKKWNFSDVDVKARKRYI